MAKPEFYCLAQDHQMHLAEFFYVHPGKFEGRKIKTLCGIATVKYWPATILTSECNVCVSLLPKLGGKAPITIKGK
jgi:hypothetical protein